jgi:hypothetical protein
MMALFPRLVLGMCRDLVPGPAFVVLVSDPNFRFRLFYKFDTSYFFSLFFFSLPHSLYLPLIETVVNITVSIFIPPPLSSF